MEEDHVHVVNLKKLKNVFTAQYVLRELKRNLEAKVRRNLKNIVSLVVQVKTWYFKNKLSPTV